MLNSGRESLLSGLADGVLSSGSPCRFLSVNCEVKLVFFLCCCVLSETSTSSENTTLYLVDLGDCCGLERHDLLLQAGLGSCDFPSGEVGSAGDLLVELGSCFVTPDSGSGPVLDCNSDKFVVVDEGLVEMTLLLLLLLELGALLLASGCVGVIRG